MCVQAPTLDRYCLTLIAQVKKDLLEELAELQKKSMPVAIEPNLSHESLGTKALGRHFFSLISSCYNAVCLITRATAVCAHKVKNFLHALSLHFFSPKEAVSTYYVALSRLSEEEPLTACYYLDLARLMQAPSLSLDALLEAHQKQRDLALPKLYFSSTWGDKALLERFKLLPKELQEDMRWAQAAAEVAQELETQDLLPYFSCFPEKLRGEAAIYNVIKNRLASKELVELYKALPQSVQERYEVICSFCDQIKEEHLHLLWLAVPPSKELKELRAAISNYFTSCKVAMPKKKDLDSLVAQIKNRLQSEIKRKDVLERATKLRDGIRQEDFLDQKIRTLGQPVYSTETR